MKKIIWVFGESATGKETLVNKLYHQDEETLDFFNMSNKKICISHITIKDIGTYTNVVDNNDYDDSLMDEDNLYFNRENAKKRRSCILYDVDNFINSDNDILLIKGQINDLRNNRGNTASYFLKKYGNIKDLQIEVIILQVTDLEELRKRINTKKWFNRITDLDEREKLLRTIPLKQESHKNEVIDLFSEYNIPIFTFESFDNTYQLCDIINNNKRID